MGTHKTHIRRACLGLFLMLTSAASAADETVAFAQIPPPVQKAIQVQLSTGKLGEIRRAEENGVATYTVEITREGRVRDFTLDAGGVVISMEIGPMEAPMAVLRTIQQQVGRNFIENIDKSVDNGQVFYEVAWSGQDGKQHAFTVLENGALESISVALEETPPPVNATIVKEIGNGQLKELSKTFDEDQVYYDVTITRDGFDHEITVAPNGKLYSRQNYLWELPWKTKDTVQRAIGAGAVLRIDQFFVRPMNNRFPFRVESRVDGKPYIFNVDSQGNFLGVEQ